MAIMPTSKLKKGANKMLNAQEKKINDCIITKLNILDLEDFSDKILQDLEFLDWVEFKLYNKIEIKKFQEIKYYQKLYAIDTGIRSESVRSRGGTNTEIYDLLVFTNSSIDIESLEKLNDFRVEYEDLYKNEDREYEYETLYKNIDVYSVEFLKEINKS